MSNTAYLKKDLESKSTLSTMTRVVTLMEPQEGYIPGKSTVCFVGESDLYGTLPGFESVCGITGNGCNNTIVHDASNHYYNAYRSYFNYVLNYPIKLCSDDIHDKMKTRKEVKQLPCFPDKGCIKQIDNILVVKMGD